MADTETQSFPLDLRVLDHYTLIVKDAASVAKFHQDALGFKPLRIQKVNAGSVPDGQYDMLNHVLQIPGTSRRVLVITEGLTEDSIFRRYMQENGEGVHHVAYEVNDLEGSLVALRGRGIKTTSAEILTDPLTGLRQIFIDRQYCGYFLELIERTETASTGVFTNQNMSALANTMISYLKDEAEQGAATADDPVMLVARSPDEVVAFLLQPDNLGRWTGHRTVRVIGGKLVEVRMVGDIPLNIDQFAGPSGAITVRYRWGTQSQHLDVVLEVQGIEKATQVTARLDSVPPERMSRTRHIIQTELEILAAMLEGRESDIKQEQLALINEYHLEVYQRRNL